MSKIVQNKGRAVLIVLDSVGIGGAPDADKYGDAGADTFGHILDWANSKSHALRIPHLTSMGMRHAWAFANGLSTPAGSTLGAWGCAEEISKGKDTTSGHWEIAGAPVDRDFHYFPNQEPAFPKEFTDRLVKKGSLPGLLGNQHASGTEIIKRLGEESLRTDQPIIYTSADSVVQIAAHEEKFGLDRLYDLCKIARCALGEMCVGRIIARPFIGGPGNFSRTHNRKDFSLEPFSRTLLDELFDRGRQVTGVGKISDIFAKRGISASIKASGIDGTVDATLQAIADLPAGGLVFTNIVEFDSEYGHRRDVAGYARALEAFDLRLPDIVRSLKKGDLLILTADHGNDPTWHGSDHTRERVPVLTLGEEIQPQSFGLRLFSDIGATIARHLGIEAKISGTPFL